MNPSNSEIIIICLSAMSTIAGTLCIIILGFIRSSIKDNKTEIHNLAEKTAAQETRLVKIESKLEAA
jgi:hypothetical protein